MERKAHWEAIYKTREPTAVSWYQPHLRQSLALIQQAAASRDVRIIDVGGGASTLVDDLLSQGFTHLTVLDISGEALSISKARLGKQASLVEWLEADVTQATLPAAHYNIWHDRAAFHFLTEDESRRKYLEVLRLSLRPGGHAILAAFGPNGPSHCSGLAVRRSHPEALPVELGEEFTLCESVREEHRTPTGATQEFFYGHFIKQARLE